MRICGSLISLLFCLQYNMALDYNLIWCRREMLLETTKTDMQLHHAISTIERVAVCELKRSQRRKKASTWGGIMVRDIHSRVRVIQLLLNPRDVASCFCSYSLKPVKLLELRDDSSYNIRFTLFHATLQCAKNSSKRICA